jgi:glutamine cyclotransferase
MGRLTKEISMFSRLTFGLWFWLVVVLVGCGGSLTSPTPMPAKIEMPVTPATATATAAPTVLPTMTATAVPASPTPSPTPLPVPIQYTYRIINRYPHDPTAFTQGLVWDAGTFIEGTGLFGQSDLRRVALETGAVLTKVDLSDQYFGEGLTLFDNQIIQITWQAQTGFVYDAASFDLVQTFSYPTEGWGITHDGTQLIVSDGTDNIYFWDPDSLTITSQIQVFDENGPVVRMNELEYIDGLIYANIWLTDQIAQIDPASGQVVGWIDLSGLLSAAETAVLTDPTNAVLNGIAYDSENGRLFVTGKLWPTLFEIELIPRE